jgi:hypothetical protein
VCLRSSICTDVHIVRRLTWNACVFAGSALVGRTPHRLHIIQDPHQRAKWTTHVQRRHHFSPRKYPAPLSLSTLVSLASRYTHALFGMQIRARPEIHLGLDAREVLWFQHTFPEFATFKTLPGGAALYMYWQGRRRAFLKLSLTGGARSVFRQQISSGKKCMLTLVVIIGNGPALLLGKDCLWISSRLYRDHSAMAEMLRIRV